MRFLVRDVYIRSKMIIHPNHSTTRKDSRPLSMERAYYRPPTVLLILWCGISCVMPTPSCRFIRLYDDHLRGSRWSVSARWHSEQEPAWRVWPVIAYPDTPCHENQVSAIKKPWEDKNILYDPDFPANIALVNGSKLTIVQAPGQNLSTYASSSESENTHPGTLGLPGNETETSIWPPVKQNLFHDWIITSRWGICFRVTIGAQTHPTWSSCHD